MAGTKVLKSLQVQQAAGDLLLPALGTLFGSLSAEDRRQTILHILEEVRAGRVSLEHLLVVRDDQHLRAVGWALPQAGRTAYLYPPVVSGDAATQSSSAQLLMSAICRRLDAAGILACQCPGQVDDHTLRRTLLPQGFVDSGRMTAIARDLSKPLSPLAERDVVVVPYEPRWLERFARLVELTYIDSQDFPELGQVRGGRNALAAHQEASQGTSGWWLFQERSGGEDVALLLTSEQPLPDGVSGGADGVPAVCAGTTDLVYLGVVPTARGRGWGRWLIHTALERAQRRGRRWVETSVIDVNVSAAKIYKSLGFVDRTASQVYLRLAPRGGTAVLNTLSTAE